MILAGYSPNGPQLGVSSSLTALAVFKYFESKCSVLLVQIGFQNNLEETLLGMEKWKRKEFFDTKGMDELLRDAAADRLDEDAIKRAVISLRQNGEAFDLLPATTKKNVALYEEQLEQFLPALIQRLNGIYDVVCLDFGWGQGRIKEQIRNLVDAIYLFLPQNRWVLEDYNRREAFLEKEKIILPCYQMKSIWNLRNLKWRYPEMGKHLVGAIPWDVGYMDAWSKGKGMDYLTIQCDWKQKEKNLLMDSVEKIWQKIEREVPIESRSEQKAI